MSGASVLVGFALARQPGNSGHAWVALHWLLGLRRAGLDAVLVDRFPGEAAADRQGLDWVRAVLGPHDIPFCILDDGRRESAGMSRREVLDLARRSTGILNVMGYVDDPEILEAVPRRAFVDIDPGFVQLWCELGLADPFAGHEVFATVGTNVGRSGSLVPACSREWHPVLPPVVLDLWRPTAPCRRGVTTVATWRGIYGPVEYLGRTYGLRVHEFRRFTHLAKSSRLPLEPALQLDPEDDRDRAGLEDAGWRIADPGRVASTPAAYQRWITESTAELCIAKQLYVDLATGWFSDRSASYLAAGRPVIAQDTGFGSTLTPGDGLLTFTTPAEALAAIDDVADRWHTHSRAARRIAEEHLDAAAVLPDLLTRLELQP